MLSCGRFKLRFACKHLNFRERSLFIRWGVGGFFFFWGGEGGGGGAHELKLGPIGGSKYYFVLCFGGSQIQMSDFSWR